MTDHYMFTAFRLMHFVFFDTACFTNGQIDNGCSRHNSCGEVKSPHRKLVGGPKTNANHITYIMAGSWAGLLVM